MQGRVDGLLIMSPHVDAAFLRDHLPGALPAVLMNTSVANKRHATLNADNYGGAHAMARHLRACGHRDIAFIAGPKGNFDARERLKGFRDGCDGKVRTRVLRGDFSEESGYRAGRDLAALPAAKMPDAIFAANDMMAVGCLFALTEAGLRVPDDVALAGFDDIPIARFVTPPLTTVRVRIADLGHAALEQLVARMEAPDAPPAPARTLPCEIVIRASCGHAARKRSGSSNHRRRAGRN